MKEEGIIEKYNSNVYRATPKKDKIIFVKESLKEFNRVSANGLARRYIGIFKNTKKKPPSVLKREFNGILRDLVDLGILCKNGSSRGVQSYIKIIYPNRLKGLKNEDFEKHVRNHIKNNRHISLRDFKYQYNKNNLKHEPIDNTLFFKILRKLTEKGLVKRTDKFLWERIDKKGTIEYRD